MTDSFFVRALYAYSGIDTQSLSFRQGDIIEVLSTLQSGWCDGVLCDQKIRGWFPSNYVTKLNEEDSIWAREEMANWWEGTGETESSGESGASNMGRSIMEDADRAIEELLNQDASDFSHGGDIFSEIAEADSQQKAASRARNLLIPQSVPPNNSHESEEDYWIPKVTYSGQLFYYNTQTTETSREIPLDGIGDGVIIPASEFEQEDITITQKVGEDGFTRNSLDTNRMSVYSDDSALDADFGLDGDSKKLKRGDGLSRVGTVSTFRTQRVSTTDLLGPPPPPLLVELESDVADSIQALINGIGLGGRRGGERSQAQSNEERDRLSSLGDSVVSAIRILLQASGVLDSATIDIRSPPNALHGQNSLATTLDAAVLAELRPFTRRVTSNLSKLVLSIRAVWGLLETISEDLQLSVDVALSPDDREKAEQQNEITKYEWVTAKEGRLAIEAKLRSDILNGARDVQTHVLTFIAEFSKHFSESTDIPSDRAIIRMPKDIQGTLQTTAATLLLPGGGYGGNWRGNGFVTLPSPNEEAINLELLIGAVSLGGDVTDSGSNVSYTYPRKALSAIVIKKLSAHSFELIDEADALRATINALNSVTSSIPPPTPAKHGRNMSTSSNNSNTPRARPLSTSSLRRVEPTSSQLLNRSSQLIGRLSEFLNRIEDIDVAASVDFELLVPRTKSRSNVTTNGISKSSGEEDSTDVTKEYQASVQQARPLIAELEIVKQALYDIAPALLTAVQNSQKPFSSFVTPSNAVSHPNSISPLSSFSPVSQVDDSTSILEVLDQLRSTTEAIIGTFTSLGVIADIQATTATELRSPKPIRPSPISKSDEKGKSVELSPSSSRQSLPTGFDEDLSSPSISSYATTRDRQARESVDSDFFFPSSASQSNVPSATSPPPTPSSMNARSRGSKTSAMFSAIGGGWDRRESNATTVSNGSDGLPFRKELPFRLDSEMGQSPTRSPSKMKLAKILGPDSPSSSPMRSNVSLPESVPLWLGSDYGQDEISFNMEGQVKGGTMKALVIAAASHEGRVDSNYLSTLLMTYRTFCTSHQLLDLLFARFQVEAPMGLVLEDMRIWEARKLRPIRARVANVLKSWVREHMDHDEFDPDLLRRIADFATSTMRDPVQSPQIIKVVEERLKGAGPRSVGNLAPGPLPASIVPRGFRKLKFIDIDPLELARQLTIMDGRLFSKITPQECLGKAWPKEYGSDASNISAMIDMSNGVTRWVGQTILAQDDAKKRANIIKHFIAVAERCLGLNNFSTLIHIIAGLNSTPIHRLRRTWETLSQKSMITLTMLNKTVRPDKNYKDYRELLRGVAPPCVPFLGVYLTDWTFIGDGNPDFLREKPHQINFQKRQKASELILMIKLHQSTTYNLSAVPTLIKYLEEQLFSDEILNPLVEDQRLYEISLVREPREREDEKIARLLSESGFL